MLVRNVLHFVFGYSITTLINARRHRNKKVLPYSKDKIDVIRKIRSMIYFKYHDILFENKASCFQYSMEFVNLSNYDFSIILLVWQPVSTGFVWNDFLCKIVCKMQIHKCIQKYVFIYIQYFRNSTNIIHHTD